MNELMEKFKSRKFLTSLVGVILGLAMIFGLDQGEITNVAGAVTALGSIVTYILAEAKVDAAAAEAKGQIDTADSMLDWIHALKEVPTDHEELPIPEEILASLKLGDYSEDVK